MVIPEQERKRILAIAREVRRHVRKEAGAYCPPQGLCGEASLALSVRLTRAGIPHEVWAGVWRGPVTPEHVTEEDPTELSEEELEERIEIIRGHVWIVFPQYDHAILDVTADQYHNVPGIWFPAKEEYYDRSEKFNVEELFEEAERSRRAGRITEPFVPLAGPRFRRPLEAVKVHVRNHLRHPRAACLCHRSKTVDRIRRGLVRRLR